MLLVTGILVLTTTLASTVVRFDAIGATAMASQTAPAISIAVLRDGNVIYARGFGFSDVAAKTVATRATTYAIGSISKQFGAAAILQLAQDRRLSIDDPLSKFVEGFPGGITLRNLLNQTSGLHNYPNLAEHSWPTSGTIDPEQILNILRTDKPDFDPGARWEYSNTNYALLTAVVEKVSGMSYGAFLQSRIFGPLHMTSSGYGSAATVKLDPATPYRGIKEFEPQAPISLDLFLGAGGIISNVNDLAAWDNALMQGTLLPPQAVAQMWTPGHLNSGEADQYGFGFVPGNVDGHRELWHNGLSPGAGGYCLNAIFPDDHIAIIVLSNGFNFDGQAEKIVRDIFEVYYPLTPAQLAMRQFTPATGEDPAIRERVQEWVGRFATQDIDRAQLTPAMNAALTPDVVAQSAVPLAQYGAPQKFEYAGKQTIDTGTAYVYRVEYASTVLRWIFVFAPDGKLAGARFLPWTD